MTNPRIEKVNTQIANTKAKISEYQSKLRVLERQKIDLENEGFIALIRSEKISDAELAALMQSLRKDNTESAEAAAPAREIITTRQEEIRDANSKA